MYAYMIWPTILSTMSGKAYKLGNPVKAAVVRVDMELHQIICEIRKSPYDIKVKEKKKKKKRESEVFNFN